MPRALTSLSILTLLLPGCAPFAGGRPIVMPSAAKCSDLYPSSWREKVPGAPLPADDTVGAWMSFGDAQTGKLDQANGRTADVIDLTKRCEERDAAAVKKASRGIFGRLFG